MIFVGIDPGQNKGGTNQQGGVAIIDELGTLMAYAVMPSSAHEVLDWLREQTNTVYQAGQSITAVVENVGFGRPGQGVSSTAKFMRHVGEMRGLCIAQDWRLIEPRPQAWKKVMLAGTDTSKAASCRVCENLFPTVKLVQPRCRKPHDGIAEAILLAEYGRREWYKSTPPSG